ncbi:SDR family oxidoreductase [Sphingomonas lacusdianchii]|uniref:SDR family oxidoreductase n=1 Tax=Sphingomonas lacusdianchii TaxID=2917992 RepID=UPI0032216047
MRSKSHRPSSIIQRATTVEEVANLCVYIASSQAFATTGAALGVDGGVVNTIARPSIRRPRPAPS